MTDCVVEIELTVPTRDGDDVPASGYLQFAPSKRRDLEGSIVLPDAFTVRLDDEGKAQVELAPTVDGDWAWKITERIHRGKQWYAAVPDGPGPVDYDDLDAVDKDTLNPSEPMVPVWKEYVDTADADLQAQINAVEAGDVDSVAGLTGTVEADDLKTALSLTDDTVTDITALYAADAAETLARTNADTSLASAIASEVTRATADVDAEETARIAADTTLQTNITAEAALARNADNLTSGTVADARIAATIARDSEVTTAIAAEAAARDAAIAAAVAGLINGAPGALDTLKELADAINDDASFAASVTSALAGKQPIDTDLSAIAAMDSSVAGAIASDGSGWIKKSYAQFKTALGLVKGDVGLGSVDNTADTAKPVSTAQQAALDLKQPKFVTGTTATSSGTAAKTATISGYTPTTGDVLALTFTNGNSVGSLTLNINSAGAVSVALAGTTGFSSTSLDLGTNAVVFLYYSGSRWEVMGTQFQNAPVSQATAEAGSSTTVFWWTPLRVRQAIAAYARPYADIWQHTFDLTGTPNSMSSGAWSYGGYYGFNTAGSSSAAYNSVWYYDIEPGTWSFDVGVFKAANAGIITFEYSLDNSNWVTIAASVDLYNAGTPAFMVDGADNVVISAPTRFYVRVRSAGTKNASSSGYYCLSSALYARRTA